MWRLVKHRDNFTFTFSWEATYPNPRMVVESAGYVDLTWP